MTITLRDVAAESGVSLPTASQILNPSSGRAELFSVATRERVRATAARLGYRPNMAARSTSTGRFGAVTLLLSSDPVRSQLPGELFAGIDDAVAAADLHLLVARLPDQKLTDAGMVPKLLQQLASDGLLINYNANIPPVMVELIDRHSLPGVWINSKQKHDCVHPADREMARAGTRLLLDAGHRRIAFVDYTHGSEVPESHYSARDRRDGYFETMKAAGLEGRMIWGTGDIPYEERIAFTRSWLEARDCPTAVLCYSNHEGAAIMSVADRMGLSIPRDLTVIVVHDRPVQHFEVHLPTLVLPEREVGLRAVAMLIRRISGQVTKAKGVAVPHTLANGDWIAPPRQGR